MEKLLEFIKGLPRDQRAAFCERAGTSEGYLRKAVSIGQKLGAELCVRLERESDHAITRRDLRPEDWQAIWPELEAAA